jgi:hypothetical protein
MAHFALYMSGPESCANAGVTMEAARHTIAPNLRFDFTEYLLCTGASVLLPG